MQKNKNSSQKKSKRLASAQIVSENAFRVGPCAQKYAESLADPFTGPADACMPVTPAVQSRKLRTFIRTRFQSSSVNGAGFVTMQPLACNDGAVTAGNIGTAAAYTSSAAWLGPVALPNLNPATAGVIPLNHNGEYSTSAFSSAGVQARLVSMGFRLRYAGTELNRGGRVMLYEDPDHSDWSTGASNSVIMGNEKAKEHKIGEDWITLCTSGPVVPSEFDYVPYPNTPNGGTTKAHYLLATIDSAAVGSTYDVEFYWNWEITGILARGKTPSDSDDLGFSVAVGALRSQNDGQLDSLHPVMAKDSLQKSKAAFSALVQRYATKNTSGWVTKAVNLANRAEKYVEKGAQFASAAGPLLALL